MDIVRPDTDAVTGSMDELAARLREAERRAYEAEAKYDAVLKQLPPPCTCTRPSSTDRRSR